MANVAVYRNPIVLRGVAQEDELLDKLLSVLLKVVHEIPRSSEKQSADALLRARHLVADASLKAAAISGALALPPGPLGLLTILPDIAAIWRLQGQLVADIGAVFGKNAKLTEESMIYCLFRHATAQVVRDVAVRMGQRVVVQQASLRTTQRILKRIGSKIIQRSARAGAMRLLPLIGALGVAVYAYYDTEQVGETAIDFFRGEIDLK
jgi:hypothetical protein